jgi:hypothetical protein
MNPQTIPIHGDFGDLIIKSLRLSKLSVYWDTKVLIPSSLLESISEVFEVVNVLELKQ